MICLRRQQLSNCHQCYRYLHLCLFFSPFNFCWLFHVRIQFLVELISCRVQIFAEAVDTWVPAVFITRYAVSISRMDFPRTLKARIYFLDSRRFGNTDVSSNIETLLYLACSCTWILWMTFFIHMYPVLVSSYAILRHLNSHEWILSLWYYCFYKFY